tara:strand:- start:166 stop:525 length:360 start_codon:yes stop_codon:yes gene_type:complete
LDEWDRCSAWLEAALYYSNGTHTIDDVLETVQRGDAQFWHYPDAAVVTEIMDYPQKRVLRYWLAGGNLKTLLKVEPSIRHWSQLWGCVGIEIIGRKGWHRVLKGFKQTGIILAKDMYHG